METVHLLISGKVQGVFFRQTAARMAERFNLKGWIKNRPDSKVETLITGTSDDIISFINWCKTGPEKADVTGVVVSKKPAIIFKKFEVLR
jgi:acylphosphatase